MKADTIAVLGLQWGDEGKGKVIDYLSEQCDAVARFGGGANAGHTIVISGEKFILKLLPSGILRPGKLCFIGAGVACDLEVLESEIEKLESRGISTQKRVFLDFGAHLVLPLHKLTDGFRDAGRGSGAIDTTKRGIGPTYSDKASRVGIRAADIFDRNGLETKLGYIIDAHRKNIGEHVDDGSVLDPAILAGRLLKFEPMLRKIVCDVSPEIIKRVKGGSRILFEGAQGALLDLDFGSYPYVTSSHTTVGGIFTGLGIPPSCLGTVVGVFKAYMTRVGHGPFPTEVTGRFAEDLRERGKEYGSVTGRPRRVGWLDLANLKRMIGINGVDRLAVTKLDVLDSVDEIQVCESYRVGDMETAEVPSNHPDFNIAEPTYTRLEGWKATTAGCRRLSDLPKKARAYLDYIAEKAGAPIWLISTGFSRDDTIIVE